MAEESGRFPGMLREEVRVPSTDGRATCVGDLWLPASGEPRGVVQVAHGMVEHLGRYEDLAADLAAAGLATCGVDHAGHGRTCPDAALRGVFDPRRGADVLVEDQHAVRSWLSERLPGVPVVLLGHSMGSFVVRCYLGRHGEGLAGAVVMGTAWLPRPLLRCGRGLARAIAALKGWDFRSRLLDSMGVGGYNRAFEGTGARTGFEWLSRDPARALAYAADPDCGWMFSVSGYYALFGLLLEAEDRRAIARVPRDLPVLVVSGDADPVGDMGRGPVRCFEALRAAGLGRCELEMFEGARHELLGETNRAEVVGTLVEWVGSCLP